MARAMQVLVAGNRGRKTGDRRCSAACVLLSVFMILLCMTMAASAAVQEPQLADAAMRGDRNAVASLLKEKANVNEPQGDGMTALHWAAYRDDAAMAQMLLNAGANVMATTRIGAMTPLFMAAKNGSAGIMDVLLKAGADASSASETGTTPLMLAAASGKPDAVKVLLDRDVDVNAKDITNEQTALMFAAAFNRTEVIRLLGGRGANLNLKSKVLQPVARSTANGDAQPARARDRGGSVLGGLTALHFAAREGHLPSVRELVSLGADVNIVAGSDKMSIMTMAILNGHFDIGQFLLDRGADPNLASTGGATALFATIDAQWAARTWYPPPSTEGEEVSHIALMKSLLDKGANPDAKMGPKLWFRGFHGDWVDSTGATAFWRAAQSNDIPAMKLLVAYGADPTIGTAQGCSPLQVAAGFGLEPQVSNFAPDSRIAAVRYLIEELGADVNAADNKGYTPLHGAALAFGDKELIMYLVARGGDVKAKANMVYGRADDTNRDVESGTGDTVADMANGPRERNLVYPETVALLQKLGSQNSDNCRASTCVLKTVPEPKKQ